MKEKKQKRIGGAIALSVLLASGLSTPTVAMAEDTTTAGADQTGIYAEAAEQTAASAGNPASDQQTVNNQTTTTASNNVNEAAPSDDSDQQTVSNQTTITAPNNVNTAAPSDDKEGSDISYKANASIFGMEFPVANVTATITPEDANSDKTLEEVSADFKDTDFGKVKAGDLVVKGDMSIDRRDTTHDAAHDVEKDSKHDVEADLDVSAIHTSIEESGNMLSDTYGDANAAKAVYVNNLETGLRSTFTFGSDLNGEFYVPASLEDAQAHYILSSADGAPLIYRINYANSSFAKDKVTILMDLDLTHMKEQTNTYDGSKKVLLYGENGVKENFNHTDAEYGDTYDTSTFGNLRQLITSSAKKIRLVLKDVQFHSASGNSITTENDTETITTTQGSINGTLVGYMKADVGHNRVKGNVSYVWGAMQDATGRDVNAKDDKVMLTTQFTKTTPKIIPSTPDTPINPDTPNKPNTPVKPDTPNKPNTSINSGTPSKPSVNKNTINHAKTNQATNAVTVDKVSENPQTGNTSNLNLWIFSIIASAGMCAAIVYLKKKKSSR